MKDRLKNWITSLIGVCFLLFAGFMFWFDKGTINSLLVFALGLLGLYAKDEAIKVFIQGISKMFK